MKGIVNSPLLEIAMVSVNEVCDNIDINLNLKIRTHFTDFINGKINHHQMCSFLYSSIRSVQPLEKIEMILSIPDEPIPNPNVSENLELSSSRKKTRTWTQFEDLRLIAAIHRHGHENWAIIAKYVGNGRTRAQCSQRWHRVLDPRISKDQWTQKDDEKLLKLITTNGLKGWTRIAQAMGNRSDVQCRYHYYQLKKEFGFLGKSISYFGETKKKQDPTNKSFPSSFLDDPFIWIKEEDLENSYYNNQADLNNCSFWA